VYGRRVGDRVYTFDLNPGLERGALILEDRETHTRWSQLTARAIDGPLARRELTLQLLTTQLMTWKSWRNLHPDTSLFTGGPSSLFAYQPVTSGMGTTASGHEEFVLGTRVGEAVRAYPFPLLDRTPILNDDLGGMPIVVAYSGSEGFGLVWDRTLDGRVLRFRPSGAAFQAEDDSGGRWDLLRGEAISGALAGRHLSGRWATPAFTGGWRRFFGPDSLYKG